MGGTCKSWENVIKNQTKINYLVVNQMLPLINLVMHALQPQHKQKLHPENKY